MVGNSSFDFQINRQRHNIIFLIQTEELRKNNKKRQLSPSMINILQASASFSSALSAPLVCHQETMLMAWCGFCREETPQIHIMLSGAHGKDSTKKLLENDHQMANSLLLSMDTAACPTAYTPVLELR